MIHICIIDLFFEEGENKKMKKFGDFVLLLAGNILSAVSIGMLALPLSISLGGTSGLAKVISHVIPVSLSVLVFTLNMILFAIAFVFLGRKFAMKTLFSAVMFPLLLDVFSRFTFMSILQNDLFLASVLAGVLLGAGSGLILRGNGSSGGFDIIAVILNERFHIPAALVTGLFDTVIMLLQFDRSMALSFIYGAVMIFVCSATMNRIVVAQKQEVKMMIFSEKTEEIREKLLNEEDCGLSIVKGESGYARKKIAVLISVLSYDKVRSCKEAVLSADPNAFIVLENVQAAYSGNYYLRRPQDLH